MTSLPALLPTFAQHTMKIIKFGIPALLFFQSCGINDDQDNESRSLIRNCDELCINYYEPKDSFAFITTDTLTIDIFKELITQDNQILDDSCSVTQKLIYKDKGKVIFTALVSILNVKDSISCNHVFYTVGKKLHGHKLTYRAGMSIDAIYSHKINPKSNPWPGADTSRFHYQNFHNNR